MGSDSLHPDPTEASTGKGTIPCSKKSPPVDLCGKQVATAVLSGLFLMLDPRASEYPKLPRRDH